MRRETKAVGVKRVLLEVVGNSASIFAVVGLVFVHVGASALMPGAGSFVVGLLLVFYALPFSTWWKK